MKKNYTNENLEETQITTPFEGEQKSWGNMLDQFHTSWIFNHKPLDDEFNSNNELLDI